MLSGNGWDRVTQKRNDSAPSGAGHSIFHSNIIEVDSQKFGAAYGLQLNAMFQLINTEFPTCRTRLILGK